MLPDSIGPVVRTSILYHHENQMGTGYPDGLAGDSIGVFSKIIRVADAYCAAIADRVDYKAKLPVVALYEMLHGDGKQYYDPEILSVFGQLVPPFPIGAKLKLQDGRYAVVVRHNRKSSFQPVVIIAFDKNGNKFSEDQIEPPFELGQRDDVRIDSFAGEDLSFLNDRVYKLQAKQNHDSAMSFSFP